VADSNPKLEDLARSKADDEKPEPAAKLPNSASSPFALRDVNLLIPHGKDEPIGVKLTPGSLVCIVGRVGTGKSALLSGLLSEMRQISGHTRIDGDVSYGKLISLQEDL
jgi:ATP-binding cassette subfamily C (CFTR/MRP) protein 1